MSALITGLDHAFASTAHDVMVGAKAVVSWEQKHLAPDASQIESVTGLIPVYGPEAAMLERIAFASFGVLAALLHANNGDVQKTAAANPNLSTAVLNATAEYLKDYPAITEKAVALTSKV